MVDMVTPTPAGPSRSESFVWWARMARDPLAAYVGLRAEYGDVVRVPYRRARPLWLLSRPEHAEQVLVSHQQSYVKSHTYGPLRGFLGSGLLTSEGEVWRRHRQIVGPVFARRHLDGCVEQITAASARTETAWRREPPVVDVAAQMRQLTLDVVGRVLFGTSIEGAAHQIGASMRVVQRASLVGILLAGAMPDPLEWSPLWNLPGVRQPVVRLRQIVATIIAGRRAAPPPDGPRDLLDVLITGRGDGDAQLSDAEIGDEVLTLMVAGHETTAAALTWTFALLSRSPTARRRLESEVDDVLPDHHPTADDVARLPFTQAVVNESLRLRPPAWTIERDAVRDDVVAGTCVGAGSTVVVSPYLLHRDPAVWPDPERFDPQRFLTGRDRPANAFLPFGAGRRICVGAGFAMLEMTLLLASISRSYRLDLDRDEMPRARAAVTLNPRGPVLMRITPRSSPGRA